MDTAWLDLARQPFKRAFSDLHEGDQEACTAPPTQQGFTRLLNPWWICGRMINTGTRRTNTTHVFWLHAPGQPVRLLDASERELLLGFGPGHTEPCQAASLKKKSLQEHEDIRCSLCGDSFAMVPFTVMGAVLCQDLVPRMSPTQVLLRLGLAPGASCHPDLVVPLSRWLAYGAAPTTPADAVEMVKNLGLSVNHTGSDVRVISGQVLSP